MAEIAAIAAIASGVMAASAAKQQGKMAQQTAMFNAAEQSRKGQEEMASKYRAADEKKEKMNRILSEQRARAAVGGAGGGEGYDDVVGDTVQRGEYLSDIDIFAGDQGFAEGQAKAANTRFKGNAEKDYYNTVAIGKVIDGVGNAASGYAKRSSIGASASASGGGDDGSSDLLFGDNSDDDIYGNRRVRGAAPRGRYYG